MYKKLIRTLGISLNARYPYKFIMSYSNERLVSQWTPQNSRKLKIKRSHGHGDRKINYCDYLVLVKKCLIACDGYHGRHGRLISSWFHFYVLLTGTVSSEPGSSTIYHYWSPQIIINKIQEMWIQVELSYNFRGMNKFVVGLVLFHVIGPMYDIEDITISK